MATPVAALPDPPHTLTPFARVWSPEREPSLSLLGRRRLTLLDVLPPGADAVRLDRCPHHGTPILTAA